MATKTCQERGNIRYPRYQAAAKAAGQKRNQKKIGVAQVPQSIYRCPKCGDWHVSSQTPVDAKRLSRSHRARLKRARNNARRAESQ